MSPTSRAARIAAASLLAALFLAPGATAARADQSKPGATAARAEQPKPAAPRRLDAITIEGEIPLPQVLFITSRGAARFDDGLIFRFLPSAAGLGQALGGSLLPAASPCVFPAAAVVPGAGGTDLGIPPIDPQASEAPREGER